MQASADVGVRGRPGGGCGSRASEWLQKAWVGVKRYPLAAASSGFALRPSAVDLQRLKGSTVVDVTEEHIQYLWAAVGCRGSHSHALAMYFLPMLLAY